MIRAFLFSIGSGAFRYVEGGDIQKLEVATTAALGEPGWTQKSRDTHMPTREQILRRAFDLALDAMRGDARACKRFDLATNPLVLPLGDWRNGTWYQ